jgi:predicted nucleotidyltransferase
MALQEEYKQKVIAILSALFPHARIILYGSRARGTESERSDIDVCLDAGKKLDRHAIAEAKSMLSESDIPYGIDIVDLHAISDDMRTVILSEGIEWKS